MEEYKIWVSYYNDEQVNKYGLNNDENHELFATHHDIEGKNINHMHTVYSEMVLMWYVWKNNLKSKYVGFNHYRRMFNVDRLPQKGECQIFQISNFGNRTVYEQYAQWHNKKDMDVMLSVLDNTYGKDNPYSKHILESHILISRCCFLMKWGDFTKMCNYLFKALDDFAAMLGISTDSVDGWIEKAKRDFGEEKADYQVRVLGYLAERLISAWISTNLSPYYYGRNVAIVNYNTPELTEAAIKSLFKHTSGCHVYVFDNSDTKPFKTKLPNVEVIDNTKGQIIDFEKELVKYPDKWGFDKEKCNYGSAKHTMSVDYLMKHIQSGFVLMDSDVLVTKDIKDFFNGDYACVGSERIKKGVPQMQPFLCYINVPKLKDTGVTYYNGEKMWALSNKDPNQHYETGAWFLEELKRCKLPISYANIWQYIIHLGHGSWKDRNAEQWLKDNESLWK